MFCLNSTDRFGNKLHRKIYGHHFFGVFRTLDIVLRPCVPRQRTLYNTQEKCLVNDITNHSEVMAKLEQAKAFVGEATLNIWINK